MSEINHLPDLRKKGMTRAEMLAKLEAVESNLAEFGTITDSEIADYLYEVIEALRADNICPHCNEDVDHE